MAISIIEDLVVGAQYTQDKAGFHAIRLFNVTGLTPGPGTLFQASSFCPSYGAAHPIIPNCICVNIQTQPTAKNSTTSGKVVCTYGPPELLGGSGYKITISGSGGRKTVSYDPANGKGLFVNYTSPGATAITQPDYVDLPILSPNTILTVERIQQFTGANGPLSLSLAYRRKVNSGDTMGGKKWTWLCRDINAVSIGNTSYQMSFVFEYDPDTWIDVAYYVDRKSGNKVPNDIEPADLSNPYILGAGNNANQPNTGQGTKAGGARAFLAYSPVDFSPLAIPAIY